MRQPIAQLLFAIVCEVWLTFAGLDNIADCDEWVRRSRWLWVSDRVCYVCLEKCQPKPIATA